MSMKGECLFNPPIIINTVESSGNYIYTNYTVRPVVECTDWCHNYEGKDQTGETCRHCKYFRVFKGKEGKKK